MSTKVLIGRALFSFLEGEMPKDFWRSKTFWFNGLFLLLSVVSLVAERFGYADFVPGEEWQEVVAIVLAAINLILRYVTVQPIVRVSTYRKR